VTVQEALQEFYGKDLKLKQQIINKIFPHPQQQSLMNT
jgi:hypothetical protein